MYSLQLPTAYGPAAFNFLLSPTGHLTDPSCPTLDLPPALLRLSYPGADAADLRRAFGYWLPVLRWLVEPSLWRDDPPEYLAAVHARFQAQTTDYDQQRKRLLTGDSPTVPIGTSEHLTTVRTVLRLDPAAAIARFPLDRSAKAAVVTAAKQGLADRIVAAGWLTAAFPLVEPALIDDWLVALGKTRTTLANNFLFRQLEQPGYLYAAGQILTVLANSRLKPDHDRVLALYDDEDTIRDNVGPYVHLLGKLPFPKTRPLLENIVRDHPLNCLPALKRIYRYDEDGARQLLRQLFRETTDYAVVSACLRYTVTLYGPGQQLLPLGAINERLADPVFLDNAQVTWPQKLSEGWLRTLRMATPAEVHSVVVTYLEPGRHGRIYRNVLLQLKEYLTFRPGEPFPLTAGQEAQLLTLLESHYDKVSTVATDVIQLLFDGLGDKAAATDAVLRHFVVSRYRLMDAGVLKKAAMDPALARRQTEFFARLAERATTQEKQKQVKKMLPYLRFLPKGFGR